MFCIRVILLFQKGCPQKQPFLFTTFVSIFLPYIITFLAKKFCFNDEYPVWVRAHFVLLSKLRYPLR